jgi:hypothetical protein
MPTRIHVNQSTIRSNRKHGRNDPVISIKRGKNNTYCHVVEILGPSKVVYQPDCPLSCGARVWIETTSWVMADGVLLDSGSRMKRKETGDEQAQEIKGA